MKKTVVLLFAIVMAIPCFSKKKEAEFGEVSKEELLMTKYDKDTSANAVVLWEKAETTMEFQEYSGGFVSKSTRHIRIKIFNEKAFHKADFRFLTLRYFSFEEKVTSLKAYTFNLEDNKIVKTKLDKKGVFKKWFNDYFDYNAFTMPNVKKGSVMDIYYELEYDGEPNLTHAFQDDIPVIHSEYYISIPEYYKFNRKVKGYLQIQAAKEDYKSRRIFKYNLDYSDVVHEYVMDSIPAFEKEEYMLSENNYKAQVEYEIRSIQFPYGPTHSYATTWEIVNEKLMDSKSFGEKLESTSKNEKLAKEIIDTVKNPTEQAKIIYEYVKANVAHDGRSGLYFNYDKSLNDILKEKKGSVTEINFLLIQLLKNVGLSAYPAILSTRNNGMIFPTNPTMDGFNYVVAAVYLNGKPVLLDASTQYLPMGMLPYCCLNDGQGRLISKNYTQAIDVIPEKSFKEYNQLNIDLTTSTLKMKENLHEYAALEFREKYKKANKEEEFVASLEKELGGVKIQESKFNNIDSTYKAVNNEYTIDLGDQVNKTPDMIYINPLIFKKKTTNPFKLQDRKYPIDYGYKTFSTNIIQITIPEGYKIEEMPKNKIFAMPENGARYQYTISSTNNTITIMSKFSINKKQFLFTEYETLKLFYNQMIEAQAQQLILKKI